MINITPEIKKAIQQGAAIALSVSGGKDGQAMTKVVMDYVRQENLSNYVFLIHADLGSVEWPQSMEMCKRLSAEFNIPLEIVSYPGGLMERWRNRMEKLKGTGKPFWSSSASRYCTSDTKRAPIDKALRRHKLVISCEGIRAAESSARAKKPISELRKAICTNERKAYNWRPILNYTDEQVWQTYGHTTDELWLRQANYKKGKTELALRNWKFHPAYVFGNKRVSCMMCVLAQKSDLENGAKHNPKLLAEMIDMERQGKATFKKGFSLTELLK